MQPERDHPGCQSRWNRFFASGSTALLAVLAAVALTLPSVRVGWLLDDHYQRLVMTGQRLLPDWGRSQWDLFKFLDGNPDHAGQMMDMGFIPWWTWPHISAGFWRPLSVATHWLDYHGWPRAAWLMHVHSVAWYGLLAGLAAVFYRRMLGLTCAAGVAAMAYAIDDAHGFPVGWIANRNAVIAACFGFLTLIVHDAWRRSRRRWGAVVAPLVLAMSLLSAEAGIATCAYLFAYVVFIDASPRRQRAWSLVPYVWVVVAWRAAWSLQGYGTVGLGLYTDPLHEPGRFFLQAIQKAPILLLGQWGLPPSDLAAFLGRRALMGLWVLAVLVLAGLAVAMWPRLRHDRVAKFWAGGMLLSLLPICATFPSDRLLFFVGLGAMGLLGMFLQAVVGERGLVNGTVVGRCTRMVAWSLVAVHLVLAPAMLVLRAAFPAGPERVQRQLYVSTPLDESIATQEVVIVNAPSASNAMYLSVLRVLAGQLPPLRTRVLAPAVPWVDVRRVDEQTLAIRAGEGYLGFLFDTLFRDDRHPFAVGEQVRIAGMAATILELTDDRRPLEVLFRFDRRLEDPLYRWLFYKDGEFLPFSVPAVGQTVRLEGKWPA